MRAEAEGARRVNHRRPLARAAPVAPVSSRRRRVNRGDNAPTPVGDKWACAVKRDAVSFLVSVGIGPARNEEAKVITSAVKVLNPYSGMRVTATEAVVILRYWWEREETSRQCATMAKAMRANIAFAFRADVVCNAANAPSRLGITPQRRAVQMQEADYRIDFATAWVQMACDQYSADQGYEGAAS